jgi:hypothetical protein
MELTRHPLSKAFPSMSESDHAALTADIASNGQIDPITIYQDEVLDGWHRYQSCLELGKDPCFVNLAADIDPVAFVISRNMHRRHLTGSQRAAAVVSCSEWATVGKPKANMEPGSTLKEMAKAADVSEKTIQQAKTAVSAGLGDKVRDGELSVKKAAEIAKPIQAPALSPQIKPQGQPDTLPGQKEETVTISKEQYEEMSNMLDESLEFEKSLEGIIDGDFKLESAMATIKQQLSLINSYKSQLESANNKNNEMIKIVKGKDRQILKLEKELLKFKTEDLPL